MTISPEVYVRDCNNCEGSFLKSRCVGCARTLGGIPSNWVPSNVPVRNCQVTTEEKTVAVRASK